MELDAPCLSNICCKVAVLEKNSLSTILTLALDTITQVMLHQNHS